MVRLSTYDIMLDGKGYMLARDESGEGPRAWEEQTLIASTLSRSPTDRQYGQLPSTVEAPMVWRDLTSGYGDRVQQHEGRYHYALNLDCRFNEHVLPGPAVTTLTIGGTENVNRIFEFDDTLMVLAGRYCKRVEADDTVVTEKDLGASNVAVDAAIFNDVLYVSLGFGGGDYIYKRTTGDAWSQDGDVLLGHMAVWKERLWAQKSTTLNGVTTTNGVQNVSNNPFTAGDWTTNGPIVGDPGTAITSMGALADMLYVGKIDGLHGVDTSNIAPLLTPELRPFRNAENCVNMAAWHGIWFVPHMRGLLTYRDLGQQGFLIGDASPGREVDTECPVRGRVTAIAGDDHWLYVALLSDAGDTYILAGRTAFEDEERYGPMIWHPLIKLVSKQCDAMHISGLWTNPRLFFGSDEDVAYIILPRNTDNPSADTNCTFATTGQLFLPAHSWYAPATIKVWKSVKVYADHLSLSRYIEVYYSLDWGAWALLGTVTVSPTHTLAFPTGGVSGNDLRLRLDLTATSSTPVIIRGIVAIGAERPDIVTKFTARIRCADKLPLRSRAVCPRNAETIRSELLALASNSTGVTLVDPIGTAWTVLVHPEMLNVEAEQEGAQAREMTFVVQMTEFEATTDDALVANFGVYGTAIYGAIVYA